MARTPRKTQPSAEQDKSANRPSSTRTRAKAAKASDMDTASKAEELVQSAQPNPTGVTLDTQSPKSSDDKGGIKYREATTEATGIYAGVGGKFGVIAHAGKDPIQSTIGISVFNTKQKSAMSSWKLMQYAVITGKK